MKNAPVITTKRPAVWGLILCILLPVAGGLSLIFAKGCHLWFNE